jgi:hypothetical protein
MKNHLILLFTAFLSSLLLACSGLEDVPDEPVHTEHIATFKGLIVGINYDTNPDVFSLSFCEADATSIRSSLCEEENGWESDELTLLLGSAATKNAITTTLSNLVTQAEENDYILVYYSGHGTHITDVNGDEVDGFDEAIVPVDCDPSVPSTLITDDELGAIFSECITEKGVIIYEGSYGDLDIICLPIMTASGPNECACETVDLGHGIFTYYILEGLNNHKGDSNNDNCVSVIELFDYAKIKTELYTSPPPQHPMLRFPMDFIDICITR